MSNPYDPYAGYRSGNSGPGQQGTSIDRAGEAGNMGRNAPGYHYGGLGEGYFADLARQYGAKPDEYRGLGMQAGQRGLGNTTDQDTALSMLKLAAEGGAPSAAQIQMQRGLEQNNAAQQSMASGARGGPGAWAAAQRQAALQMSNAGQDIIGQQSTLRAQEMAQARDAYAGAAGQQRGQNLQALGLNDEQMRALMGLGLQQQGLNQQGMLGLYGMGQGSAGREQQGQLAYNDYVGGVDAANRQREWDLKMKLIGGMSAAGGAMLGAASDERVKKDIALEGVAARDPRVSPYVGGNYSATHRDVESALPPLPEQDPRADFAGLVAASGPPQRPASEQMLEQIQPVSYRYKGEGGDKRYGVIAQDLERSPMGRSVVRETPAGKTIDGAHAAAVSLAALADLHQRIKALEGTGPAVSGNYSARVRDVEGR